MIMYFLVNKTKEKYTDFSIIARICCIATCITELFSLDHAPAGENVAEGRHTQLYLRSTRISHFICFVYNTDKQSELCT